LSRADKVVDVLQRASLDLVCVACVCLYLVAYMFIYQLAQITGPNAVKQLQAHLTCIGATRRQHAEPMHLHAAPNNCVHFHQQHNTADNLTEYVLYEIIA